MNNKYILDELEPEVKARLVSRRDALKKTGLLGAALASAPVALGALSSEAFGQGAALPQQIVDVLNFALTLEELEAEFYNRGNAANIVPQATRKVFKTLEQHEEAHVKLLRTVLGSSAVAKPTFDFTAGGTFADVFTNYQTFLALSQAFEDTGVRAYKGQAANLMSNDTILETALRIHSVEARHASEIRRIRGQKGWITGDSRGNLPAAAQPIYDGDDNRTQAGVTLTGAGAASPDTAVTEAFDEPLTREQVLAIVQPFIRG